MNTSHALVRFLQPGRTDAATCEDTIVATDAFKAVIDGATSKTDFMVTMEPKENEAFAPVTMTGGKFVAEILAEYIRAMPADIDFERFAEGATATLDKALQAVSWPENAARPEASVALYSEVRREVWVIGDCKFMIGGLTRPTEKAIDAVHAAKRAAHLQEQLKSGIDPEALAADDTGRALILDDLRTQHRHANNPDTPFGYAVINGNPIPAKLLKDRRFMVPPGRSVVLATDGFRDLHATLEESLQRQDTLNALDPLHIGLLGSAPSTKGISKDKPHGDDMAFLGFTTPPSHDGDKAFSPGPTVAIARGHTKEITSPEAQKERLNMQGTVPVDFIRANGAIELKSYGTLNLGHSSNTLPVGLDEHGRAFAAISIEFKPGLLEDGVDGRDLPPTVYQLPVSNKAITVPAGATVSISGGYKKDGENFTEAGIREATEELGLQPDDFAFIALNKVVLKPAQRDSSDAQYLAIGKLKGHQAFSERTDASIGQRQWLPLEDVYYLLNANARSSVAYQIEAARGTHVTALSAVNAAVPFLQAEHARDPRFNPMPDLDRVNALLWPPNQALQKLGTARKASLWENSHEERTH